MGICKAFVASFYIITNIKTYNKPFKCILYLYEKMFYSATNIKVINKIPTNNIIRCPNKLQEPIGVSNAIYHLTHKKIFKNIITPNTSVRLEL